jgi:hypothetical protein
MVVSAVGVGAGAWRRQAAKSNKTSMTNNAGVLKRKRVFIEGAF